MTHKCIIKAKTKAHVIIQNFLKLKACYRNSITLQAFLYDVRDWGLLKIYIIVSKLITRKQRKRIFFCFFWPEKGVGRGFSIHHHTQCIPLIRNYDQGLGRKKCGNPYHIKENVAKESLGSRKDLRKMRYAQSLSSLEYRP